MRITFLNAACLIISLSWPGAAKGEEWRPARLWVVGGESSVWVVGQSQGRGDSLPVVQMWRGSKTAAGPALPRTSWKLPPVSGDAVFVAADAEALHVLFSDLTTYDYFEDRSVPGARWADQCRDRPLAWGGDGTQAILWALVETDALTVLPTTREAAEEESEAPEESGPLDVSGPSTSGDGAVVEPPEAGRLTLLRLRRGRWSRHPVLSQAQEGERFWLSGRDGAVHLFWGVSAGGVSTATLADAAWGDVERVTAPGDVRTAWAGAWAEGPVLIVAREEGIGAGLQVVLRRGGQWLPPEPVREGTDYLRMDPPICGVGVARDRLCVARVSKGGKVEFGTGLLGVSPSVDFKVLPASVESPPVSSTWEEAAVLALVLAIMTGVVWTRREQMVRPVQLPAGVVLAAIHRRLLATILDYLPAVLLAVTVALPWLDRKMGADISAWDWAEFQRRADDPELLAMILPVSYAAIVLYGLWCLLWELWIGSTPGKLVFKCRVMSLAGKRPTRGQFVVRNAMRTVMLALGMPGIMVTLMTMVMVSRNRQRLGDVLANTIVVEPGVVKEKDEG